MPSQGHCERQSMNREIESDGYITREADLSPTKRICATCRYWKYEPIDRGHICVNGHSVHRADWREKYEVCDKWEKKC